MAAVAVEAERPRYRSFMTDSGRWSRVALRPGDIVLSAPPKCGITWLQMLCAVVVFESADLPAPLSTLSPWLDLQTADVASLAARLAGQPHRRFLKTHTPFDGLPFREDVTYLCIGRDPRDVVVSWHHHVGNLRAPALLAAVAAVAPGDLAELIGGADRPRVDLAETLAAWIEDDRPPTEVLSTLRSTLHHLGTFWQQQERPNVHLFHYGDLEVDLVGQVARLAAALGVDLSAATCAALADAASFPAMRSRADELAPDVADRLLRDNASFFRAGASGGWRGALSAAELSRYDARCRELAPTDLRRWVERG